METIITAGATATAVGTGQANTTAIATAQGVGSYAAQLCNDLVLGGYNDWFLPSKDELHKMYINLQSGTDENGVAYNAFVGNFALDAYWSSSELEGLNAEFFAYGEDFDPTVERPSALEKDNDLILVRCVRTF